MSLEIGKVIEINNVPYVILDKNENGLVLSISNEVVKKT